MATSQDSCALIPTTVSYKNWLLNNCILVRSPLLYMNNFSQCWTQHQLSSKDFSYFGLRLHENSRQVDMRWDWVTWSGSFACVPAIFSTRPLLQNICHLYGNLIGVIPQVLGPRIDWPHMFLRKYCFQAGFFPGRPMSGSVCFPRNRMQVCI